MKIRIALKLIAIVLLVLILLIFSETGVDFVYTGF